MAKYWTTPEGEYFPLYKNLLAEKHLLICGATGSGKSVIINGLLHTALTISSPGQKQFILVDLKRVELADYKKLPQTLLYASEPDTAVRALQTALDLIETRYQRMEKRREKLYTGTDVYVIIDELADLMTTNKKQVQPLLQRICQIGRAARVHVIAATQCPIAAVIPTQIKVNFDTKIGLRTASAQDSRNILGCKGCESLPAYGYGYIKSPSGITLHKFPMIEQNDIETLCRYWQKNNRPKWKWR